MVYDDLTPFEKSYVETMCWSSTDDNGRNFDGSEYCDTEFAEETLLQIHKDCFVFERAALPHLIAFKCEQDAPVINSANLSDGRIAHDFWLTRNRHGAGFWDGDYPEPLGKQLTDIAHSFGEQNLYVGDDGKFYLA